MGFDENKSILLSSPPYYYAVIPVIITSIISDTFHIRGPIITFNCLCLITGFALLGFSNTVAVRYIGTFLATGAYVSNWAALTAFYQSNIAGQWKRAFTAAVVTMLNGAGGIAGSFIVRQAEAPHYWTAIWVSMGSHVVIVGLIAVFAAWFFVANRRQRDGKAVLEQTEGFRYTF